MSIRSRWPTWYSKSDPSAPKCPCDVFVRASTRSQASLRSRARRHSARSPTSLEHRAGPLPSPKLAPRRRCALGRHYEGGDVHVAPIMMLSITTLNAVEMAGSGMVGVARSEVRPPIPFPSFSEDEEAE